MQKIHVVIGRFEPPHRSHIKLISRAAEDADFVLVVLGSAFQAPTCKNPFTWEERAHMIGACLPDIKQLRFLPVRDRRYDNAEWAAAVVATVDRFVATHADSDCEVTLFGSRKPGDTSTWYLHTFPNWKYSGISSDEFPRMDATNVRDNLFKGLDTWERFVLPPVRDFLRQWIHSEVGVRLRGEYLYRKQERRGASRYPYPLTYTTADAVICHWGHVLLIRRKGELGRGLWALPGGFIDAVQETCYQSAKREAQEETGINLRDEWCVTPRSGEVYDDPGRSLRGRTITHAYCFVIPDDVKVPQVKGGDDAAYACWHPLSDIPGLESRLFEDHIDIIRDLTAKAGLEQPHWRPELL